MIERIDEILSFGELEVAFVNPEQNFALLTNGYTVPVIHWFNRMGEDCTSHDAVVCVAGSDDLGWFTIDLIGLDNVRVH